MKNINVFALFVLFVLFMFIAFKIGDSRGYEAGFKYGYGLDCREELDSLKAVSRAIYGQSEKSLQMANSLSVENARLRYEKKADSVEKATGKRPESFESSLVRAHADQKRMFEHLKRIQKEKSRK